MKRLRLIGEVSQEMYAKLSKQLDKHSPEEGPIVLEICSEGGCLYAALAISGRIRNSDLEIYTLGYGQIMSSAVLILASGDKRYMSPEAWVMLHETQHSIKASSKNLRREAKQAQREELQWATLLSELSKGAKSPEEFLTASNSIVYLTAEECVKMGLVDELVSRKGAP